MKSSWDGWDDIEEEESTVARASKYARSLMRDGTPPGLANWKAAQRFGLSASEVAKHTGRIGSLAAARRSAKATKQRRKAQ